MISKIIPVIDELTIADPKSDLKKSSRVGRYRIGNEAIFFPLNINWAYIPLKELTNYDFNSKDYTTRICCASATLKDAVPTVEIQYAKDGKSPLEFTSLAEASRFAKLLDERLQALRG
ncbi:MAG: hypothetical protein IJ831_00120 [Spirochaetales bacterium]|nr:hypothetical protein [Spirochaetales bacterium]